jgi:hypothetical protein
VLEHGFLVAGEGGDKVLRSATRTDVQDQEVCRPSSL